MTLHWPEWFFVSVADLWLGVVLLIIGCILLTWGFTLVHRGWNDWRALPPAMYRRPNWLHPSFNRVARFFYCKWVLNVPDTFDFSLGSFMIGDSTLWLLLGASILLDPEGVDLWVAILFTVISIPGLRAFLHWARDRMVSE